ncbi:Vms1/Ankzf1 family peptidyl-tRNA hydrolase [uncultured Arthrobacter sp.]|uniref:baeRF2 domain-containing protein n=1 Tax=uncultured Arthrobacter sp. TaxID=114050 RepID=UPI00261E7A8F|nr:Vms1/Ankzf1 family peptidyl-tRNA hydrolase [uncultured Arthrobacter sp.]
MTSTLHMFADLYRKPGPWVTVYTDASTGTVDSLHADDVRPDNIATVLEGAGASKEDRKAVAEALRQSAKGLPDPVARLIIVANGEVELDEFLPGPLALPEFTSVNEVPNLCPLLWHRPDDFAYVVAEVGRDGGEIHLRHANSLNDDEMTHIEGDTENLKKVPSGGWSQGRYQHRTENIWKANAADIAGEIDRVVRSCRARLLVVAGDIRARNLVAEQLSEQSKEVLSVVESHSRTEGADKEAYAQEISKRVAECIARRQTQLLERLNNQKARANPESTEGIGSVVHALQQAQVDTLLLESEGLNGHRLLALGSEPWTAEVDGETAGAPVLGEVPAPSSLLRAAVLTDAEVALFPSGALDGGPVAALLRWPVGPTVPAAR